MNDKSLPQLCSGILSEREEKIFNLYFGIDCSPMELDEIANEFEVTRERVRQIFNKALKKIQKADFDIWDNVFQSAKTGFLLRHDAHTFDSKLDDLTIAKICHSVYKKQCAILCTKELNHAWMMSCERKKNCVEYLSVTKEHRKKSPIDPSIDQLLSYSSGDDLDLARRLLEDLVCFNKKAGALSSLMPLRDRFVYLLKKSDGVISTREIVDNLDIGRDRARWLMRKGPCITVGKPYAMTIATIIC